MDSINNQKAVNSHQSKVVDETQNNKANYNNESHVKGNQSDLKDTNFEYEDNEYEYEDIGIGDLIIDLDADIEKSSSSNIGSTLVIPLQNPSNLSTTQDRIASASNKSQPKAVKDTTETILKKSLKNVKTETATMSSNSNNSNNKAAAKMSIDHQATLDKGLKMKIKRTKTGTKTSESKHEIVKTEQNGSISSADENVSLSNCKKQSNQIVTVPASPSASANKRGNSGHRKDKAKEKVTAKDKNDPGALGPQENFCVCSADPISLTSPPCTSSNCIKNRDISLAHRISNNQSQIAASIEKQNSFGLNTPNAPGPPKDSVKFPPNSNAAIKLKDPQKLMEFGVKSQISGPSTAANLNMSSISSVGTNNDDAKNTNSPPMKRAKCDSKNMIDVCVGTSIGTITEPDCLGPCEPGTSVTLEGIVWHETDGGVLAVNVTWRGKTYVGTLIDCTKHDWAPPRFCDSPTEELDSRLPKGGRGKRGRNSTASNDLLNFTETRSSVHSKLRNGGSKGRAARNTPIVQSNISQNASSNSTNTPSTSPTAFLVPRPEKRRKSKDDSPSPINGSNLQSGNNGQNNSIAAANSPATAIKKSKSTTSPCAISPILLECPEQDCSKKYKHANGLKYHQSHAHGVISNTDEDSLLAPDSPSQRSQTPPPSLPNSNSNDKTPSSSSFTNKINFDPAKTPVATSDSAKLNNSLAVGNESITSPSKIIPQSSTEELLQNESNSLMETMNSSPLANCPDGILKTNPILNASSTPIKVDTTPRSTKTNIMRVGPDSEQISNDSASDSQSQNSSFFAMQSQNLSKTPNLSKTKKNRKSPGPDPDSEVSAINRPDGVRSPAYSDISDDSNTPTENTLNDKLKIPLIKKSQEPSGNPLSLGSYNSMYGQFYQQSPFFQPPESQSTKPLGPQVIPPVVDYGKPKEQSPLDLMNKLQVSKNSEASISGPSSASNNSSMGKLMPHYPHYPYNFIQPSYPYNMDGPFGSMSGPPEDPKNLSGPGPNMNIKEEHSKDNSPESMKQMMSSKNIKIEGSKDIKSEPGQVPPSNLSQSPQHLGPYSSIYQRHSLGMPPISREEEIQRYFIYPDQRRSNMGNAATNLSSKDERTAPSPTTSQSSNLQSSNQHSLKSSKSMSSSSLSKSNQGKDLKDEKEVKVKQEGQKPTMETQGPPPPPTSQYYLPFMPPGGSPFYPEQMYRNMMVPTAPYNSPYHLQMPRFPTPEDLSRNPNTKALDLLQHHANQYYNTHKIHELSERGNQLKSPNKVNVSSPNVSQPLPGSNNSTPGNNSNNPNSSGGSGTSNSNITNSSQSNPSAPSGSSINLSQQSIPSKLSDKGERGDMKDPLGGNNPNLSRTTSPPPQRHVHTHHHTHVGVGMGFPIYPAPYVNPAVLASQQAAAVAVINPFTNPPSNK